MTKAYFNNKASIWDNVIAEKEPAKLQRLVDSLGIISGSTVLDVGTGTGVFVPFLLNKIGSNGKLVCVDYAEQMLNKARAKQFKGNVEFLCADISETQFGDATFDSVVCYSSFPHIHDKQRALREIQRVLKGKGTLYICHSSSRDTINRIHRDLPEVRHDLIPSEKEMRQMLSDTGFERVRIDDNPDSYLASAVKS